MVFELQSLLDLRHNAEKAAELALQTAVEARAREEAEQARLHMKWQQAAEKLMQERQRLVADPETAAQATAREQYLARLRDHVTQAKRTAETHAANALAMAVQAEVAAQNALAEAHAARVAVEKLEEKSRAEEMRIANRRAEDVASDLASARYRKT